MSEEKPISKDTFTIEVFEENRKTLVRMSRQDAAEHPGLLFERGDEKAAHMVMKQIADLVGYRLGRK